MKLGYIHTLYTDALPEGRLPTREELVEVLRNPTKANPFLLAYLRQRPEYAEYIRYCLESTGESASEQEAAEAMCKQLGAQEHMEQTRQLVKELLSVVGTSPDRDLIIEKLSSLEIVIADLSRLTFARQFIDALNKDDLTT